VIVVTGGTGFIGQRMVRRLSETGHRIRLLLKPSPDSPTLARGVAVEAAVASLSDERGVRAALVGARTILHLAGAETSGRREALAEADVVGTRTLAEMAGEAGVEQIVYLSHLGADRASAYPLLRAKALAEEFLRDSGVPCAIVRTGPVFGPGDHFTRRVAMLTALMPAVFFLPGDGTTLVQPLHIDDLQMILSWLIDAPEKETRRVEIGGPEYLTFRDVVSLVMHATGQQRSFVATRQPYLRGLASLMTRSLRYPPATPFWLDYLATHRTAPIDSLSREFGLQPARMESHLAHLAGRHWRREWLAAQRRTGRG
jgi:NADH dehydrogenase